MKVNAKGIASLDVQVDPVDVLYGLKESLGFGKKYDSVGIYKEKIMSYKDTSYHGSPTYEYTLISEKEDDIEAFKAMSFLIKYLEKKANAK